MPQEFDANYFSDLANERTGDIANDARKSLIAASDTNPDQAAKASQLSRQFGIPQAAVEQDLSFYEKEKNFAPEYFTALSSQNKDLANFIADQDNAKMIHDDVGALLYTADKVRSVAGAAVQFGSDIIGGTGDLLISASELAAEGQVKGDQLGLNGPLDRILGPLSIGTTNVIGQILDFSSEQGLDKLAEAIRPPEERRDFVDSVAEGIGQVASQIVLFVRNPAAGTGALFATGAEQQSDRLDAAGINDPGQRLLAQVAGGGVTAATERVQLGVLLNKVPGLNKLIGKAPQALKNKWFDRVLDVGTAAAAEATQEVVEGFLQDLIAYGVYNPDQEFLQTWREEAATSGVVGAIARTGILAVTGGRRASTYQHQAQQAEQLRNAVTEAKQAGEGTKLIARDPEKFKEFLSNANSEGQEITLDGTVVEEMYQSEQDMEKFFEAVPEARAQFAESQQTGSDIRLPADKLVYAMAADQENSLDFIADFVKPEGGLSASQSVDADFVNEQIEDILRQAREEQAAFENEQQQQEFYERVERQVSDNLMDANRLGEKARTPDAARQEAALYASFAKTLIERGGASAQAVLENVFGGNFEVRGPTPPPPSLPITGEDAYIDSLRKREIAKATKAQKKSGVSDLLGKVRKPREKATPKPLINALINRGKIQRGSPIAAELEAVGIDPKTYPRLFAKDGALSDIDNIPVDELQSELGVSGVFRVDEDLNGYVDRQELIDLLRDETFGNYIKTDEQIAQEQQEDYDQQILDELTNRGVDITTADNDTIKRTLEQAAEEYASGDTLYQNGRINTESEAFKRWFGDSKVVDENGDPLVVYHGTDALNLETIDTSNFGKNDTGFYGKGIYLAKDPKYASHYATWSKKTKSHTKNGAIYPLYVSIKNPFIVNWNKDYKSAAEFVEKLNDVGAENISKQLKSEGYDGIFVYGELDHKVNRLDEIVAFRPNQIKSVNNRGTFDPNDPRILYQNGRINTESEAFKNWFGDSQVVDEGGNPKVVYHGTRATDISEFAFDYTRIGEQGRSEGAGFYFTDSIGVAEQYGTDGSVIEAYLSIKKPLKYDDPAFDEDTMVEVIRRVAEKEAAQNETDIEDGILSNYGDVRYEGIDAVLSEAASNMAFNDTALDQISDLVSQGVDVEIVNRAVQEVTGFDGVISEGFGNEGGNGGNIVVAFFPEQIKAVNNTAFDPNDPRILYQDRDGKRGSIQFGEQGQRVINLFEGADESTFFHETGHLFLDIFGQIAADPNASEEVKAEYARALEWLGVESADQIGTEQHEKWARGFEAYLYEGKGPSENLRGVFDRFKIWLINVYKNIKALDVKLDDNIRGVFDRLLATDSEIESLRDNTLFRPNQQTLEMLNETERAKYLKQQERAISEAKNKLFRKALRQKRRENAQWYKEERAKVLADEEQLLQESGLYRAMQVITTGKDFNGDQVFEGEYRLSEQDVVDLYGNKEILKYLPRGSRVKGDGVDLKILAEMYGFKNPKDMIDTMINADPYKLRLQKNTDEEMIRRHGDMLNDGTIEREALEAVMSESPELNLTELAALSRRTGQEYPSDGDFKTAARRAISEQKVDHSIKPDKFYRAALRAEREYGKALAKEDYEAAAAAKRRVILNKYMFKEARDAREEVNKALKHFQKLSKTPPKKQKPKIDPEYHEKIWEALGAFNLGPRLTEAKALKLELAAINEWIIEKENDEFAQLLVPPEIMAAQDKQHYRDLSLNEFRGLRDLVVNLETQGRRKLQYITEAEKRDLNELIDELELTAAQHNSAIEKPLSKRQQERTSKKLGQLIGAIDAVNTKASTILAQLDGGEYGSWTRTIFEPIQAAEVQKVIRSQTEMQNLQDIIERHYGDDYRKKRVRLKLDSAKGVVDSESYVQTFMNDEFVVTDGTIEETLTREMILTIAMHQGTADNQVKLLDGYAKTRGWTQAFIDDALAKMTKRDWDFVQDTWDYMDSFWPEVSKIEAKRYGYAPEKIEHQPLTVTTADGEVLNLRGGYMRIKYDRNQDVQSEKEAIAEVNKEMMVGAHAKAQTKNGSTNERVKNVERPIRLDMDVVSEHVNEQVAFITMSEAVENANKILRKQRVQEAITTYIGNDARLMLETWLQDTAAGGVMAGGVINRGLRALRGNYTVGRLGLRPMTALLQFSGLAQTAGDVGTANMTRALFKVFSRGNPYAISAEVKAKSPFMKEREFTLTRDVADAMRTLTRPDAGVVSHAAAYMLWPMQKMQEVVDAVAWTATYDKALREGFDDADAIRQADIAVARSQGSGLVSDLAAIERGTLNEQTQRQEWVKLATMFFSYFNAKYNVIKTKNIQYRNQQIGLPDLAVSYLMTFMLEGLISSLIMGQLDFDRDNDEEITGSEVATAIGILTMQQTAATIPFVRNIAGAAEGFTSQGAAQAQLQNVGSFVGTMARTAEKMADGDDVNWYAFMRGAVNTTNAFMPIPAGAINQALRGAEKESEDGDAQVIDYLVYRKD